MARWLALLAAVPRLSHGAVAWRLALQERLGQPPLHQQAPQAWHDGCVSLVAGDLGITTCLERRCDPQPRRRSRSRSLPAPPPSGSGSLATCLRPRRQPGQSESSATLAWGDGGRWAHLVCTHTHSRFPRPAAAEHWVRQPTGRFFSDSAAARCGEAAALGLVTSSVPSEAQGASEYHTPWVCVARSYL